MHLFLFKDNKTEMNRNPIFFVKICFGTFVCVYVTVHCCILSLFYHFLVQQSPPCSFLLRNIDFQGVDLLHVTLASAN